LYSVTPWQWSLRAAAAAVVVVVVVVVEKEEEAVVEALPKPQALQKRQTPQTAQTAQIPQAAADSQVIPIPIHGITRVQTLLLNNKFKPTWEDWSGN
jgi:hypothetical protein